MIIIYLHYHQYTKPTTSIQGYLRMMTTVRNYFSYFLTCMVLYSCKGSSTQTMIFWSIYLCNLKLQDAEKEHVLPAWNSFVLLSHAGLLERKKIQCPICGANYDLAIIKVSLPWFVLNKNSFLLQFTNLTPLPSPTYVFLIHLFLKRDF